MGRRATRSNQAHRQGLWYRATHGGTHGRRNGTGRSRAASVCTGDRKSTRLNSSHTVISYAVFCLKKKHTSMEKNNSKDTQVVYRDSKTGRMITEREEEGKDPATQEGVHIHHHNK